MSVRSIVGNALRPGYLPVIADKVWGRMTEQNRPVAPARARGWCQSCSEDPAAFACGLDSQLWAESIQYTAELVAWAAPRLENLGVSLGGAGFIELLYFLARYQRPENVVETGVAAGFTSRALLDALSRNGAGRLYSSDFPYFRLKKPETYIGVLVDEHLKEQWNLLIEGDRKNLKSIVKVCESIDLFHYDSDKSYRGRRAAFNLVKGHLRPGSVVMMDDVGDNLFFRDYALEFFRRHHVFRCGNKFVGLGYV